MVQDQWTLKEHSSRVATVGPLPRACEPEPRCSGRHINRGCARHATYAWHNSRKVPHTVTPSYCHAANSMLPPMQPPLLPPTAVKCRALLHPPGPERSCMRVHILCVHVPRGETSTEDLYLLCHFGMGRQGQRVHGWPSQRCCGCDVPTSTTEGHVSHHWVIHPGAGGGTRGRVRAPRARRLGDQAEHGSNT